MTPETDERDIYFMRIALREAVLAFEKGEVPVGAVLTRNNEVIEKAHNMREGTKDPTAHAEILVLRAGAVADGSDSWRLLESTLYVTKEPCVMCAGGRLRLQGPESRWGRQSLCAAERQQAEPSG
jgi:tRNA(adenine34) deaminase